MLSATLKFILSNARSRNGCSSPATVFYYFQAATRRVIFYASIEVSAAIATAIVQDMIFRAASMSGKLRDLTTGLCLKLVYLR